MLVYIITIVWSSVSLIWRIKDVFVIGTVQLLSLFVILAYTTWKRQTYGTTKQMTFIIQSNFSSSYLGSILDKYFEEGKSLDGKIPLFENYRNMNMTEIYLLWRETFFKDMRNTMFCFLNEEEYLPLYTNVTYWLIQNEYDYLPHKLYYLSQVWDTDGLIPIFLSIWGR